MRLELEYTIKMQCCEVVAGVHCQNVVRLYCGWSTLSKCDVVAGVRCQNVRLKLKYTVKMRGCSWGTQSKCDVAAEVHCQNVRL